MGLPSLVFKICVVLVVLNYRLGPIGFPRMATEQVFSLSFPLFGDLGNQFTNYGNVKLGDGKGVDLTKGCI